MSRARVTIVGLAALLVLSSCASAPATSPAADGSTWPTSMVVLGHSGATGWNSDPAKPREDAPDNSWATGTNPAVNSIYQRALAASPALKGHNFSVALSGSDVKDLPRQVKLALKLDPLPDLFIIQSVDNDIGCDGSDEDNYQAYGDRMADVLSSINDAAPKARIFVVGAWATVQNFSDVTAEIPEAVSLNQGGGPCDVFDRSGKEIPEVIAAYQDIVDKYQAQLRDSCAAAAACTFAGDEVLNMVIDAKDLASDSNHLSVAGLNKLASVAWGVLAP